jgi:cation transport regulator ChaC
MLYKVEPNAAADEPTKSLAWLQRKEAPTGVFKEVYSRSVYTMDGKVEAGGAGVLIFVVDESHPQYAAGLTESEQADMVAAASGRRGSNHDFLEEFNVNLQASGVRDKELQNLAVAVRRRMHSRE